MSHPAVSIVLAATDSTDSTLRAVGSLTAGDCAIAEILVVGSSARIDASRLPRSVRFCEASLSAGVPALRAIGLAHAQGNVIAFTEDSCVFAPGWVRSWLAAFARDTLDAATGPVHHGTGERRIDQAVFLCEYAPFLSDGARGAVARLAGNNFAVRRGALDAQAVAVHETEVAQSILARGGRMAWVEGAGVRHVRRFSVREAIRDRLYFGLEYGGLRASSSRGLGRVAAAFAGPFILLVQVARILAILVRRPRLWSLYGPALPLTVGLLAVWSVGEWSGWVAGERAPAVRK